MKVIHNFSNYLSKLFVFFPVLGFELLQRVESFIYMSSSLSIPDFESLTSLELKSCFFGGEEVSCEPSLIIVPSLSLFICRGPDQNLKNSVLESSECSGFEC